MAEISPFRIAFREEGESVNAYLAPIETMEGARLVGSIHRSLCMLDRALFDSFVELMQTGATALTKDVLGCEPVRFDQTTAPEHERSGRA